MAGFKLCSLVFLCCGFSEIYLVEGKLSDPQIVQDGLEHVLELNSHDSVICQGNQPLEWKLPTVKEKYRSWTSFKIEETEPINKTLFKYGSRLHIFNMTFPFVDFYYCQHKNSTEIGGSDKMYLFVNDPENLSVTSDEDDNNLPTIYGRQYDEIVIPCKPTFPSVNVELSILGEEITDAEFDRKIGFSLFISDLESQDMYCCNFTIGNKSFERYFLLSVEPGQPRSFIYKPFIVDNNNGHTTVGGEINLSCKVQSQDIDIEYLWKGPHEHEYYKHISMDQPTLVISNVTLADSGTYTCYNFDHQDHTSNESIYVNVFDLNDHYLQMKEPNDQYTIQTNAGMEPVTWAVEIWGHPDPNYIWRNNRNVTIPPGSGDKYEVSFEKNSSTLTINTVNVSDFGYYYLTGWTRHGDNKTLEFFLNVTDKPSVTITTKPFHILGARGKVNCTATAYPPPTFKWLYRPCKRPDCFVEELEGTLIEEWHMVFVSQVEIITTEASGVLTCNASNSNGFDLESIEYRVSDFKDGFDITGFDESVVIDNNGMNATFATGNPIRVKCAASILKYKSIEWFFNGYPLEMNDTYKIAKSNSDYSYILYLEKENATYKDAGKYTCRAELLNNSTKPPYEERKMSFLMRNPTKPDIVESGKVEIMEKNYPQEVELFCEVHGIPKPQIIWYKENSEFIPDESRIQLKNDNQLLRFNQTTQLDEATYECRAQNYMGIVSKTWHLKIKNKGNSPLWYSVAIIVLLIICIITIGCIIIKIRKEKLLQRELKLLDLANFEKGAVENINPNLGLDDQAELLPYDKKWEFPIENLKLGKQLGSGAFGVVMKGEAKHIVEGEPVTTVAVKMVKKNADHLYIKALASELKVMVHLGQHLNVVNLLGACTKNVAKRELLVIVEYCRYGNLQNYLLRHRDNFVNQIDPQNGQLNYSLGQDVLDRTYSVSSDRSNMQSPLLKYAALTFSNKNGGPVVPLPSGMGDYRGNQNSGESTSTEMTSMNQSSEIVLSNNSIQPEWRSNYRGDYGGNVKPISTKDLIAWSFQVARGMDYLSSRKVLHGDLAARNILLTDDNIVKICDFGLAKTMYKNDNYKKRTNCPLPVKWMAIESIRDRMFSTQSDVWSFGIVLWELFSLAMTPYPGMEADERLYSKLLDGYRMEAPKYAPREIYQLMSDCWKSQPLERPSFSKLAERLGYLIDDSLRKYYIDLNDPYLVMNTKLIEDGKNDYLSMVSPPTFEALSTPHHIHNSADDGYMSMSTGNIFSPRITEGEIFDFNTPNRKPLASEESPGHELLPMLHQAGESDSETPGLSPNPDAVSNPSYHLSPLVREANGEIVRSVDNYVNMPKNKDILRERHKKDKKDEVEERNYVNANVRDWESVAV